MQTWKNKRKLYFLFYYLGIRKYGQSIKTISENDLSVLMCWITQEAVTGPLKRSNSKPVSTVLAAHWLPATDLARQKRANCKSFWFGPLLWYQWRGRECVSLSQCWYQEQYSVGLLLAKANSSLYGLRYQGNPYNSWLLSSLEKSAEPAFYLTESQQTPSAVGAQCSLRWERQKSKVAGGFLVPRSSAWGAQKEAKLPALRSESENAISKLLESDDHISSAGHLWWWAIQTPVWRRNPLPVRLAARTAWMRGYPAKATWRNAWPRSR